MSKQFNDMLEAVNLATKLLTALGYKVHHDPTVSPVSGVWDLDTPAGRRQSACEVGALCRLASQAVDDFVTSRDTPETVQVEVDGCATAVQFSVSESGTNLICHSDDGTEFTVVGGNAAAIGHKVNSYAVVVGYGGGHVRIYQVRETAIREAARLSVLRSLGRDLTEE